MSYQDALNYLAQKTSVVELYDQLGGRVAVSPEWNGRVLTSTCDGLKGNSFGCVNARAIDAERYEYFGGEDHWTISPLTHPFAIESIRESKAVLQRALQTTDALGKKIELKLSRSISLLNRQKIGVWFGDDVTDALEQENVSVVAFRTENTVQSHEHAHIASRQRGMFNASPHAFVIISTSPQRFDAAPLPMDIDYLGGAPHRRIRHISQALLVRADGLGRCQVTMPYSASPSILGAVDLRQGTLSLWTFDLPGDSEEDIVRIYNSGFTQAYGLDWAAQYEVNCFSAARKLLPTESLVYCQHTLHLAADDSTLGDLVHQLFDVSLEEIKSGCV